MMERSGLHGWLKLLPEHLRDEYEEISDELLAENHKANKWWRDVGYAQARKASEELRRDITESDPEFVKDARIRYMRGQLQETLDAFAVEEDANRRITLTNRMKGYQRAILALEGKIKADEITPDMVERARNYPIANIIEVDGRGFVRCINHDEATPSMYTKKNFAHCFGCGWHGDSIDVYMLRNNAKFREAVLSLQH